MFFNKFTEMAKWGTSELLPIFCMHKKSASFFTAFSLFCILVGVLVMRLPSLLANTEVYEFECV